MNNQRTTIIYNEIAEKVIELFERNGFTAEYPVSPVGLRVEIASIIRETIEGNVNYSAPTKEQIYDNVYNLDQQKWYGDGIIGKQ